MNEKGVTQIPVMSGNECIGSVRESVLMSGVLEDASALEATVATVMGAPFPVVQAQDPMDHVTRLFTRHNEAVLVRTSGDIDGILTRSDLIQHLIRA